MLADERIAAQDTHIVALDARIAGLEARLDELTRPPKTPGNSSKPPSQGQKQDLPAPAADRPPRKSRFVSTAKVNGASVLDTVQFVLSAKRPGEALAGAG
jgi:hypothetical protein